MRRPIRVRSWPRSGAFANRKSDHAWRAREGSNQRATAKPKGTCQRQATSELEAMLYMQITMLGLHHDCVAQYRFAAPEREFRSDFAWPTERLLVEVEGAIWSAGKSGHKSGTGITRDCEKANLATLRGWRTLRFVEKHIRSGEAVRVIAEALGRRVP